MGVEKGESGGDKDVVDDEWEFEIEFGIGANWEGETYHIKRKNRLTWSPTITRNWGEDDIWRDAEKDINVENYKPKAEIGYSRSFQCY